MPGKSELLDQLRIDRTAPASAPRARRRGWLMGLGLGAVSLILIGILALLYSRPAISVHATEARVLAEQSERSAGGSLLDASGYVVALREATVSGKGIYKVNEVLVEEGQHVDKDQVIARLDDTNVRAALEQSKAQVKQLEAALAAAKLAADDARPMHVRNQKQVAEGLISPDAFDVSKASFDAAQIAVSVAEQNLQVAKASVVVNQRYLDDTVIRAPFAGVVTVKTAQPGEIVSPQFQGGGGIAKVVDMNSLEVDVDVSENYINRVHPHQAASIKLNAYADWEIPAEVIAVIPTADRSKATVKVRVGFKQKDARIVPEMGARVSFLDEAPQAQASSSAAEAVIVAPEAVQTSGDTAAVFVIRGGIVERRAVRLGVRNAAGQTILSGLAPGTKLAIGDFSKLSDGTRVRVEQ